MTIERIKVKCPLTGCENPPRDEVCSAILPEVVGDEGGGGISAGGVPSVTGGAIIVDESETETETAEVIMRSLKVSDLMSDKVCSVRASEDLATANELMDTLNVRHLPVVGDGLVVIGILSQRDLLRSGLFRDDVTTPTTRNEFLATKKVAEVMTRDPETVTADEDIAEAAETMLDGKYGCLPVVDERGFLTGILTESDFVRYLAQLARKAKGFAA